MSRDQLAAAASCNVLLPLGHVSDRRLVTWERHNVLHDGGREHVHVTAQGLQSPFLSQRQQILIDRQQQGCAAAIVNV